MIIGLCMTVVVYSILWAIITPHWHWRDDGDCRGLVWHTVRIPGNMERSALWWGRYYRLVENLTQTERDFIFKDRIVLPKSRILGEINGTQVEIQGN